MAVKKTKIVDPKTGARVADPSFVGASLSSGGTGTSWPEVRSQYQKGQRSAEFNRKGVPAELKSYLTGKTDKLSEDFDEPIIRSGGDVTYSRTAKNKPVVKEDNVKTSDDLIKLPVKNAKQAIKSASVKGPKTIKSRESEKPSDFISPGVEKKSRVKTSTFAAKTGGGDGLVRSRGGSEGLGSARVVNTENKLKNKAGYNRQEKQFKAYAGTSVLGESHIGKSAQDLKEYKKEYQSQRKAYRKEGNLEGVAATGMEVRQARQAERFAKGNQTHFNDENYKKTTGKTSRIALDYRDSAQNAANRNTMQSKLDAISAKPKNNTNLY